MRVVIAAAPRPLVRVVEHLLSGQEDVSRSSQKDHLLTYASTLLPDLIVVNSRLMGREVRETIAEIKRLSPKSKLILVCPFAEFSDAVRDCGADADLEEDALVGSLPPLVRRILSESQRDASSEPTNASTFRKPDSEIRTKGTSR